MYHWTVPIISVILIFSYAIPGWCNRFQCQWRQIGVDLTTVKKILQKSKYWNYHKELTLYTASPSHVDTCRNSILHCYVQELQTIVEEITLIGDKDAANDITFLIHNIETNGNLSSLQEDNCKDCEEYEEKDLEKFIEGFTALAQQMQTL
ncbi:unnamed protein product [Staurois parvus]|uniref:Interleukin n=1 Tax=Staurois parvus TaxID=386267 RepID=A0ABN9CBG4_9NEOB|nr:unnamed protein product [Staurois parvus]